MDTLLVRLAPVHSILPLDTPITDRVSIPQAYLVPISLVHPLMVSPFLAPSTEWHVIHAKSRRHGDDPAGGTVPWLVEGGND